MAQEFRSLRATAQSIGFHELRQALEISSLKQDLERVARETGDLRAHIEEAVEQVRAQFAALTPEELADANRMAPLLQSAVKSLLGIREAARRIEVTSGPVADADRPDPPPLSLLHTPAPEPIHPAEPPPAPAPSIVAPASAPAPAPPQAAPAQPPAPVVAPLGPSFWMNQAGGPPRGAANTPRPARNTGPGPSVDWLDPPRR